MKDVTIRGLQNAIKLLLSAPEFDRLRLFLIADGANEKPESEEIIKMICDEIRAHLVEHARAARVAAAMRRGI